MDQTLKRLSLSLIFLIVSVALCAASVRSAIERQYQRGVKATLSNDVDTVLAILTPDYTIKTYTGQVIQFKVYASGLKKKKASGQKPSAYTTKIKDLKVNGSTATVISLETTVTTAVDPITNEKKKLLHTHQYLDTWVKMASVWRLKSTVTQTETTTVEPG